MGSEKSSSERKMEKIWLALSYAGIIFGFFLFLRRNGKRKEEKTGNSVPEKKEGKRKRKGKEKPAIARRIPDER